MRRSIDIFGDQVRLISGRHGEFFYNPNCTYIGQALELYGEYCEHEVKLFSQVLKPTDCVWEIGANMGSQAVPLAKIVHQGQYVGFEPQVELFKILTANLLINQLNNARSINIALGARSDIIDLPPVNYSINNNFGAISLLPQVESSSATGLAINSSSNNRIRVLPVDELKELPEPDFIKMDVEGMELMVLSSAEKMIERKRPIIFAENERPDSSPELLRKIISFKYDCYWVISSYFNEDNYFKNANNKWPRTMAFNIICFPKEKKFTVNGLQKIENPDFHPLSRKVS